MPRVRRKKAPRRAQDRGNPCRRSSARRQGRSQPPRSRGLRALPVAHRRRRSRAAPRARSRAARRQGRAPRSRAICSPPSSPRDRNEKRDWLDKRATVSREKRAPHRAALGRRPSSRAPAPTGATRSLLRRRSSPRSRQCPRAPRARRALPARRVSNGPALLTLESALAKNPRSVALLRVYATAAARSRAHAEADELGQPLRALRFDDTNFLSERIDLRSCGATRKPRLAGSSGSSRQTPIRRGPSPRRRARIARSARPQAIAIYKRALELAPDDVETLRALADVYAEAGKQDEQLKLLRQILAIRPQEKDVREYVEHTEPPKPRADEEYAWASRAISRAAQAPAGGPPPAHARDLKVTTVFPNGLATRFHQIVFQPLTDEAAAAAREYAFGFEADNEVGAAPRRPRLPRRRQGRRGHRERRGRRRQPGDRDVHLGAHLLRALSRVSTRATWSSFATASRTSAAQRVRRLLRRGRVHAGAEPVRRRVRAHHAEEPHFYFNAARSPGSRAARRSTATRGSTTSSAPRCRRSTPEPTMPPFGESSGTCTSRPTRPGTKLGRGTGGS